ncbi:MAG: fatty acid desaturase [Oligoflexia bacterium]|nr:fatty acid desaturase [Oligoflexia bacterium]
MSFLERVLDPPSYGFSRNGILYVPTKGEILREFFSRLNIFSTRKNWLPLFGWTTSLLFAVPLCIFFTRYANPWLMIAGFLYGMVALGSHGTFWLHRYCTHRAFLFRNRWIAMICRNLVIKVIPEEIYVVSHYVHHRFCEQPGDPYNVYGGWLYCFLADVNHQTIRKDLSENEYEQVCKLMQHTGVRLNSYQQYLRWGSLCHPAWTTLHYALNWTFWYGAFYFLGGHALATALFGWAGVWAIGVRTFNFDGHGKGKDLRKEGSDFNRADLSVNQIWPGYVAGEWHNNHHLYPNGARSGFLPYQLDLPWLLTRFLSRVGAVSSYRDYRQEFLRDHYQPWLALTANNATKSGEPKEKIECPAQATQLPVREEEAVEI